MNELIKVEIKNDTQVVSARELYKGLEIKRRFSLWVSDNFKDFIENVDFTSVRKSTVVNNGAKRELQDYAITISMAKELCMMSHTELGKEYRKYFLELERKWNDPQEVVKRGYAILQNENARLKIENQEMKPKALFADSVATAKTNILVSDLSKIVKQNGVHKIKVNGVEIAMGPNNLFKWLRANKYLISRKGMDYNMPTQHAMNLGLFEVKESTRTAPDGHVIIQKTTKVTGKGQIYFVNKFLKDVA
ncbi:phage antirepressor KilAC domain-containing protein [Ligilactobacillus salivarius]|uniref:Phage antirepressor KilAC domain-containing protein n=1 Tax=Ligilactobacillus salivarius TaxID=1624 RepID=A0AAW7N8E5_9LACO|nr:phage antirepressor KilAC domain-containing protein [Ligilactobacillus salivarius]MDN4834037.1 phage antirepressor KilAC domain-containing protein [Ligilactobacillus salivarius]